MRTKWKLAALAFLAIAVLLILVAPLATIEVKVDLPPATTTAAPEAVNQAATWIVSGLALAFALTVLAVLAWVARHILGRRRKSDA